MEKTEYKVYIDGDYIVEVQPDRTNNSELRFWLSNDNYGMKVLFAVEKMNFDNDNSIKEYIKNNIDEPKKRFQRSIDLLK